MPFSKMGAETNGSCTVKKEGKKPSFSAKRQKLKFIGSFIACSQIYGQPFFEFLDKDERLEHIVFTVKTNLRRLSFSYTAQYSINVKTLNFVCQSSIILSFVKTFRNKFKFELLLENILTIKNIYRDYSCRYAKTISSHDSLLASTQEALNFK